jgi:hypothetical protein
MTQPGNFVMLGAADAFGVEVVGWFVEQQHVGLRAATAERDAVAFTARELLNAAIVRRQRKASIAMSILLSISHASDASIALEAWSSPP